MNECVCIHEREREREMGTMDLESLQIAWKPHFALFNSLNGDHKKEM